MRLFRWTGLALAGAAIASCGGGSSAGPSRGGTQNSNPLDLHFGALPLGAGNVPNGDLTIPQTITLPIGTQIGICMDRDNPSPSYYPATVVGYDGIDNLAWVRLNPSVTTPAAEGDSGSMVFTLSASTSTAALNQKIIGSASYGTPDNLTDFLVTPISEERATGGLTSAVAKAPIPDKILFHGEHFRRLDMPFTSLPQTLLTRMQKRAASNSPIQKMVSLSTLTSGSSSPATSSYSFNPLYHNTLTTWLARGDVYYSGSTGSVTTSDDGSTNFIGYGHPLDGSGRVGLSTVLTRVDGIYTSPVYGSYKVSSTIGDPTFTMFFDGLNGVRFKEATPNEIPIITQLRDSKGNVVKTTHHYVGFDNVPGDEALNLTYSALYSFLNWYDIDTDLDGSANFTVETTINGKTTKDTYPIGPIDGILFNYTLTETSFVDSFEDDLLAEMTNVEDSGDIHASVVVSGTFNLIHP